MSRPRGRRDAMAIIEKESYDPHRCVGLGIPQRQRTELAVPKIIITAAVTSTLLCSPALGEDAGPDQIRAKLLGTPSWVLEWTQDKAHSDPHGAPGKVETGKVSFVEKDGRLIGIIDAGWKCSNEVTLRSERFNLEPCNLGNDLRYVRSGNEFRATFGSMIYTIRPTP